MLSLYGGQKCLFKMSPLYAVHVREAYTVFPDNPINVQGVQTEEEEEGTC